MLKRSFLAAAVLPLALLIFSTVANAQTQPAPITVFGTINTTLPFAPGSTGWEIKLDEALDIGDRFYIRLPVDPGGFDLAGVAGQEVEATGVLELAPGEEEREFKHILRLINVRALPRTR